ncbi:cytochrome c [Stappia taiwanensis]|uniref:Cytochrome c n=1 Tax=Stappia taiwanensis TaxID=992267 RepID=A0A838XSN0_9HYPH|nr:cytochrome c [Stappia taiwanensis]MBA4613342.1 cytochrome c [Stappia taiwanensis]GGE81777.1 hypothetical protein GCM10007285_06740 [Stappia taiwanensis]
MRSLPLLLLLAAAAPAFALASALAENAAPALPGAPALAPEQAQKLAHLVEQDCGSCHGLTRKGGLGSPLTAEALSHIEPEGIAGIILDGVPGTAMPPWRPLMSEDEALWIAYYLLKDEGK